MYSQNNTQVFRKGLKAFGASLALILASAAAQAQVVFTISDEVVQPGQSVTVTWSYTGDGNAAAIEGRFDFDMTHIDNVDYSNCMAGWQGSNFFSQCLDQGATGDNVFFQLLDTGSNPLPDGSGTIVFDVSAAAPAPLTIDLLWDPTKFVVDGAPGVTSTNGSISITAGPQSELAVTPDPMAFGTVDLGLMPVTNTFTVENVGAASATISTVTLAGPDGEFTLGANTCGGPLAAGSTCTVDIVFNATANGPYTNQLDITSDANVNPNPSVAITGSADSVANLSINPASGAVNLGTVVIGSSASANGSISNAGSAAGAFSCTLTGDPEISVTPSPLSGTIPAGGSTDFTIACNVPDTAADGDMFSAGLVCTGDNDFSSTHEISCSATSFVAYPVPTMNKWGIALLALLMVMIGGVSVRFFRT